MLSGHLEGRSHHCVALGFCNGRDGAEQLWANGRSRAETAASWNDLRASERYTPLEWEEDVVHKRKALTPSHAH
eukprot:2717769-Amphidinium_carterae.1